MACEQEKNQYRSLQRKSRFIPHYALNDTKAQKDEQINEWINKSEMRKGWRDKEIRIKYHSHHVLNGGAGFPFLGGKDVMEGWNERVKYML